ncbi:MAG: hypothetical protein Q8O93_04775 [bacterium]|nr:hypothetical protein [bacterium]
MPPINDSKDLLYIVISISVLTFTIFSCWALYYFARILQQMFRVIKETRDRLTKLDELFSALKERIEHSASYLFLIGEGVKKLVELMKERGEKKKRSKKE